MLRVRMACCEMCYEPGRALLDVLESGPQERR